MFGNLDTCIGSCFLYFLTLPINLSTFLMKRKAETLTKEKEELIKESQALSKQLEESKQGKIQLLY